HEGEVGDVPVVRRERPAAAPPGAEHPVAAAPADPHRTGDDAGRTGRGRGGGDFRAPPGQGGPPPPVGAREGDPAVLPGGDPPGPGGPGAGDPSPGARGGGGGVARRGG